MITDYEDDAHFCLKCHITIIGLDNYVNHRKAGCSKNLTEPPKSPLPSHLLPPDDSFNLKADDFFSSLELRSSSKKIETQSTSGKNFSGILTRSKTTAVIQATAGQCKDTSEPQQSKSGKNVWIGGHQLKELGQGDNQSKLIKAVANLERRKEEPTRLDVYEESDEDSEDFDYDEDESSSDDQDVPPRNYTGGKWKPQSPIEWGRNPETRDWNIPPPTFTEGKLKPSPKRSTSPASSHTKGKWKPPFSQKEDLNIPPPTFTGSKWVSSKKQDYIDIPPPTFTGSKWVSLKRPDFQDVPPPTMTKGKWKPRPDNEDESSPSLQPKGKSKDTIIDESPPPEYTRGKWKPRTDNEDDFPAGKGKWKPKDVIEDNTSPQASTKMKLVYSKDHKKNVEEHKITGTPAETYTKGKWIPPQTQSKEHPRIEDRSPFRKSSGTIQYWCSPCNRRLASKIVYERHLKSELHFKRTSHDREFDESDEISLLKGSRRVKLKLPEPIFSTEDKASDKKRSRKKIYERCGVCQSKVNKYLIGKHLISHYHCRRGDITSEAARHMVLEHIHGVVLESPFQCSICKFYCNTQEDFLRHWLSADHIEKVAPGYFFCILCKYRNKDTKMMYDHLVSSEHMEVVSVINRSVPIVIKKINPVRCPTCDEEFMLNMQLLNHCRKFNHDDAVVKQAKNEFVCDTCGIGLLTNVSLKRHKQIAHQEKYYVCTPCNLKFTDVNEAKKHRKSVQHKYSNLSKSNDGNLKKRCEYCKECFANFLLLKEHLLSSHPEHRIRCPHCGANFAIAQELTAHLRLKSCKFEENPENSLRCEKCPFSSNSTSELIFHMALHDEPLLTYPSDTGTDTKTKPVPKYKCPVCKTFYPRASLQAHIRQHTQERPYVCEICDKTFARKNNLQFHIKNHTRKSKVKPVSGDRTYLCSVCGANFKKKSILHQHMQIHTGKLCKCPEIGCIYTARKLSEINEHIKTHSDVKTFSCGLCDYKGKSKQQLNRHMTIHSDTKKYHCSQCSFSARNSMHLRRHTRIHTGAKPYSCPHCNYKCNNLENLRKHVLSTNKHPGKCIYECKFCTEDQSQFQTNFAKEFKAHLVTKHSEVFGNGAEAATYVAGIYDIREDSTHLNDVLVHTQSGTNDGCIEQNENILKLKTDADPIVCQVSNIQSSSSSKDQQLDQMLPRFITPKDECGTVAVDHLPDSWSLVGRYDVEEESGTLIPFESDSESLFQEHF